MVHFPFVFRVIGLCGFLLAAGNALAVCTVLTNPLNLGTVTLGIATTTTGVLTVSANCTVATPYGYSFASGNGGVGATGKMSSTECSLDYSIVSYDINTGAYGTTNYFIAPPAGLLTGAGVDQASRFGVVVAAAQQGCVLPPNSSPITVTDTLSVLVNY